MSIYTIIVGHATFCMVVVFNNVVARYANVDLTARGVGSDLGRQTRPDVSARDLPMLSTALIAGALLAFALSFDEVIVTTFTAGAQNTLPLWIFGAILRGQQLPEVNAVVVGVLLLTAYQSPTRPRSRAATRAKSSGVRPRPRRRSATGKARTR